MNNFKKIGLTALAASLVSTSAFAGEVTVAGSASMTVENYSVLDRNAGKGFSMGNQLTFTGGGEMDNGMTVGISFVLDQGDNETNDEEGASEAPFDSHSVSISSDALGKLVLHGEGGSSAQAAIDTTAAGDIWDTFDDADVTGQVVRSSTSGSNILVYSLPTIVDGFGASLSYSPQSGNDSTTSAASSTAYAVSYTGVEGLTVNYGVGEQEASSTAQGDTTTMSATYAYGSFTLGYSENDYQTETSGEDQETTSWKLSYTVSDAISVSYGEDTITEEGDATDAEYSRLTASYTSGGMTVTANSAEMKNGAFNATSAADDKDYWSLGLSFAF
jgi:outer membrane protein OmpU